MAFDTVTNPVKVRRLAVRIGAELSPVPLGHATDDQIGAAGAVAGLTIAGLGGRARDARQGDSSLDNRPE